MSQKVKFVRGCNKQPLEIEDIKKQIAHLQRIENNVSRKKRNLQNSIANSNFVEVGEVVEVDKDFVKDGFCVSVRDKKGNLVYLTKEQLI